MIDIHLQIRTTKIWVATCKLPDGRSIQANAWVGAGNKLAKDLRNMGVPDQPVRIFNPSGVQALASTLYAWADYDYQKEYRDWLVKQPLSEE